MFLNINLLQENQMREKFSMFLEMLFYPAIAVGFMAMVSCGDYLLKEEAPKEEVLKKEIPKTVGVALLPSESSAMVIQVVVDGMPLKLQVDTGARRTLLIDSSIAPVPRHEGGCELLGAFEGEPMGCYFSTIDRLEIGGIVAHDVHVVIVARKGTNFDAGIDGLLGLDFMRNYQVVFDEKNFALLEKEKQ